VPFGRLITGFFILGSLKSVATEPERVDAATTLPTAATERPFFFEAHTMAKTAAADAFDFDSFDTATASEQGAEFEVIHPIQGGTGLFLRMKGTHSEQARTELKRIANRAKAARAGTVRKDDDDEGANFLASITVGWRSQDTQGNPRPVTLGGQEYPFNRDNAFQVYKKYPLVAEQASQFVFDAANFLKS